MFKKIYNSLFNRNITRELTVIFTFLVSIPLFIVSLLIYSASANAVEKEFKNTSDVILGNLSMNIDQYFKRIEVATLIGLIDSDIQDVLNRNVGDNNYNPIGDTKKVDQFIKNLEIVLEDLDGIYIFSGNRVYQQFIMLTGVDYNYNYQNEEWYKKTIEKNGGIVIFGTHKPFQRNNSSYKVLSVARGLKYVKTGEFLGAVLIDIKLTKIQEIFDTIRGENRNFAIIDGSGGVIYSSSESEIANEIDIKEEDLDKILAKDKGDFYTTLSGKKVYLNFKKSNYTGWWVIQYISEGDMFKLSDNLRKITLLIAFLSIIITIIVSYLIAKTISKPVVELSENIKKVGNGDFCIEMKTKRKDELGILIKGFMKMVDDLKELIQRVAKSQVKQKEIELLALQSQINPHFLYNTLESVQMKAIMKDQRDIAEMIGNIGAFFKMSVVKGKDVVTLKEELKYIELYIKIQKMRYDDKVSYHNMIENQHLNLYTIKFILQPIIENSIIHGLERKSNKVDIFIESKIEEDNLIIIVRDTGKGMGEETLMKIKNALNSDIYNSHMDSIGLKNVNDRLKLNFGQDYGLNITSRLNQGTIVYVKLPVIVFPNEIRFNEIMNTDS